MINRFDHEGLAVINVMRDMMVVVFESRDIKSKLYIYLKMKYTESILHIAAMIKNQYVLLDYKEMSRCYDGNQWTLGSVKYITMEKFWTWTKAEG